MWALTYDFMVGYSMDDMSPVPALAKSWETSEDGLTWTFDIRDGVKWSDGEPFTAADIAYTYNRVLNGEVEGALYGSYLTNVKTVTAPDDTTVVLKLVEAQRGAAAAADPDHPRAHLEERQREGGRDLPGRADRRASRSSAPVRSVLVEGKAGGSTYRFEKNPDYWGGAAARRRGRSSGCSRPRTRWSRR